MQLWVATVILVVLEGIAFKSKLVRSGQRGLGRAKSCKREGLRP